MAGGLTRFVGREMELAALVQALEHAGADHGRVVAVVGEAGVGKSRLVYECVHAHHLQGWRVLESASVSYGKSPRTSRSSTCCGATPTSRSAMTCAPSGPR